MRKPTEVAFNVDTVFLEKLQTRLNLENTTDIVRIAFTLLDWASGEVEQDRRIISTQKDGTGVTRLVMPELTERFEPNAQS